MSQYDLRYLKSDFLVKNIRLALKARNSNEFTKRVPWNIFLNDVLPYACCSEIRDEWREIFYAMFSELVKNCKTSGEAA